MYLLCTAYPVNPRFGTKVNAQQNAKYKTGEDGVKPKLEVKDLEGTRRYDQDCLSASLSKRCYRIWRYQ